MPKRSKKNLIIDPAPIVDPLARLIALLSLIFTALIAFFQRFTIGAFTILIIVLALLYIFFSFFGLT